jgi:hypothetical protein
MSDGPRITIKWNFDGSAPFKGVSGVDSESVPVDDLVRWARKRRRALRRDIKRGYAARDRKDADKSKPADGE